MSERTLRIATRESLLALWQAEYIKARLEACHPGLKVELLGMTTRGDQLLDSPLSKIGGKALFVKELEQALMDGRADIAVHSMKDVPMEFPEGLGLAIICEREDPRDAFVSNHYANVDALPEGAHVGTSSLRRECQLRARRPDLKVSSLRGNVQTRLRKLDDGEFDAIVLASAGLIRLELQERIADYMAVEDSLPACGQGAVGVETRLDDEWARQLLAPLHDPDTAAKVSAERAMLAVLDGSCRTPIAGYALPDVTSGSLWLRGSITRPDGGYHREADIRGPMENARELGYELGQILRPDLPLVQP